MKKIMLSLAALITIYSCKSVSPAVNEASSKEVKVNIDLVNVTNDKITVTVTPPQFTENEVIFHLPKTVPGTYSTDNYGTLVDNLKAFNKKGKEIEVSKKDDNSWVITESESLSKITYEVNDTYDTEKSMTFGKGIFSPAGSNIEAGKNFVLNNHCFVGCFENKTDLPYNVTIAHPADLWGATSLTDTNSSNTVDVFYTQRYNELVDNPIMYGKPDSVTFTVDGMEILFSVYSPTGKHSAKSLSADLEKTMRAQKKFLGAINNNKKYTVLLYLSSLTKPDARGFGALEHNSSTTVCFPEVMPSAALGEQIKDVVSHEFFHIVTPLGVHSNEIHYFDFNNPKMSKHLWMYEGVTEYFANLFQVNQGLINEDEFYNRMVEKIKHAKMMNDTMSFTTMSANVLVEPYKDQYLNVYEKGALIGMCIDIIIREKSNGERGILDLMQKLTHEYGPTKPFNDDELFAKITEFTYPEVGDFLKNHVEGTTPINYEQYFAKVGVVNGTTKKATNPFIKNSTSCITAEPNTKEILIRDTELTNFLNALTIKQGDILASINGKKYTFETISDLMTDVEKIKEGDAVNVTIKRNGKELELKGTAKLDYTESKGYKFLDTSKEILKNAWLKK